MTEETHRDATGPRSGMTVLAAALTLLSRSVRDRRCPSWQAVQVVIGTDSLKGAALAGGRFFAYATVIDNLSDDLSYVPAR